MKSNAKRVVKCIPMLLFVLLMTLPQIAQAHFGQYGGGSCVGCHTVEAGGTFWVAVDGVDETALDMAVTAAPGQTLEIDYYFTGARGASDNDVGIEVQTPATTWLVTPGTINTPSLPAFHPTWNLIHASNGGVLTPFTAVGEENSFTIRYGTSSYDSGNSDVAKDTGAEPDLTADLHGTDFQVTVDPLASDGPYSIVLYGVGHTGNARTSKSITLTVNVSSGADGTPPVEVAASLNVTPEFGTFIGSPITITEDFTDAESAVSGCEYTTDGSTWVAGTLTGGPTYTCTASGLVMANTVAYTIEMRATSGGGLSTPVQSLSRTGDTAAPTTGDGSYAPGWKTSDQILGLTLDDGTGSGAASTEWCVDTTDTCTPNVDGTSFGTGTTVNVTQGAGSFSTQYARYRSTDNLGQVETVNSTTVQIDKETPVDGALTVTPNNGQLNLSWVVATEGNALASPAYTVVVNDLTTTSPIDCNPINYDRLVYSGDALSTIDDDSGGGLTNGADYAYTVCATDVAGNQSTGSTGTAQPAAVCTNTDPTVTITNANQQITAGSGNVVYNVDVTNNDTAACVDTTFSLSPNDSNGADFATSVLGTVSLLVAPGATNSTTLTVAAVASPTNGATNVSSVTSLAAGPHGVVTSLNVTTLINVPTPTAVNYNIGETAHFEFRTNTRFNSKGAGALSVADSSGVGILNNVTMLEVQQGAQWIYTYDWDTTGQPADSLRVEIWDSGDTLPVAEIAINLNNPAAQINLFTDAGYTTPTDIFANGATVYVEVLLPSPESATNSSEIYDWYGNFVATTDIVDPTTIGTTNFRYSFTVDFITAAIANGDWGYLNWSGTDNVLDLYRPIQRSVAGCGSCTYTDPTVSIVTADQAINTDAGSVNYVINITNNDTVACGSTDFNLTLVDTNGTEFNASTFGVSPITINPGVTGNTNITVSAKTGFTSAANDTYFYTELDVNHGQSANSVTRTTTLNVIDLLAPTVDSFTVPATSTSQNVSITAFTASDAVGVTGYMVTETAVAPGSGDAGWLGAAPATYTVSSGDGSYTLYAWAKDAQGNVSTSLNAPVDVDSAVPIVTAFTVPSPQGSTTVSLTTFTASDNIGVTGFLVTESAVAPLPGAAGWTGIAPGSFTVSGGDATYTLYAWAKDAVGNVSLSLNASVTVDTTKPTVFLTDPVDTEPAAPLDGVVTITWDENIDCSTVTIGNITSTSPGWSFTSCAGAVATFTPSLQSYTTLYSVNISTNVLDLTGNPMAAAYGFSYTSQDEPCVYNDPTISIVEANQDVTADDGFVDYTVTVTNNDTGSCGNTSFTLLATENPVTADFTETYVPLSVISLAPGANGNITVRSTATGGILNGLTQVLDIKVDSAIDVNHNDSNLISRTTTMNAACNVAPSTSFVTADQQVTTDGGSAAYTVQVQNDTPLACGSTAFDLVAVDDNAAAFTTPSVFTTDPLTVAPGGATNTTTMTVTSQVGATNGAFNNTYFYTAVNGSIPKSGNSANRLTTINRPCSPAAPSFSHAVNRNIAPDGSAVYDLTIINNDVDCAASLFTFSIDSEVESNVGTFTLASVFSAPNVSVASGATDSTVTLTVTGNGTGIELDTLTSTIRIADGSHVDQTTVPVTTIKPFDPLVHSSASTGSTKWGSNWGVAGGKYGEFICATCHTPSTTNIKRIRTALPTFGDGSPEEPTENFPGSTISFLDATEPTTDFGDDSTAPRASSNRICEVCHTADLSKAAGVDKHAFNQAANSGHENSKDCTSCHKHNDGFSKAGATCDSCHGYPPQPADATTTPVRVDDGKAYQAVEGKGAHVEHVNHLAALAGVTLDPNSDGYGDVNVSKVCGVCHDMNGATHEMGGGAGANRIINFNGSNAFQFGGAPTYNGIEDDPSATTPKTCSNINCHFQATPWWE